MTPTQQQLKNQYPNLDIKFDELLSQHTYFKIGGPAEMFITVKTNEELEQLISFCHQQNIPVTILGGGSNVIVTDQGVAGVVLNLATNQVKIISTNPDQSAIIYSDAGIKTALFVRQTIDLGFQGLENFLGVPGTLGGAIYNNSHYLQDLIGSYITRVLILNEQQQLVWLAQNECAFAYDQSRFQATQEIILGAEFLLQPGNKEASLAKVKAATEYRAKTQPLGEPTSGCTFRNTPNTPQLTQLFPQFEGKPFVSAGFLIDQAGLKGTRIGDIEISHKHAAFFINKGHGTSEQVLELIVKVKETVLAKFGVKLEEEIFLIGK
jgi:UDP-N-acetylmuramate dehydrogenase